MNRRSRVADAQKVLAIGLPLVAGLAWHWLGGAAGWIATALILAFPSLVLAIELAAMRMVATGRLPHPTLGQLVSAWWAETVLLVRVFAWRQPFRWRAVADTPAGVPGARGVVFVHGFLCNRGFWAPYQQLPFMQGRASIAVNMEPMYGSIDAYAPTLDAAVRSVTQATGMAPVMVCHSMGGLAARAWLRGTEAARIHHLVTIGSPHGGTWLARLSRKVNGRQMRRESAWLRQLAADEAERDFPPATCWYSNCDNVVFPQETATLPQADNRFLPGAAHVDLAFRAAVMEHLQALLEGSDAAR